MPFERNIVSQIILTNGFIYLTLNKISHFGFLFCIHCGGDLIPPLNKPLFDGGGGTAEFSK